VIEKCITDSNVSPCPEGMLKDRSEVRVLDNLVLVLVLGTEVLVLVLVLVVKSLKMSCHPNLQSTSM